MKTRTARCCCGDLSITVSGEPERVIACHCHYCQRRTGNVVQTSCWYFNEQVVQQSGDSKIYRGPENIGIDYSFCPRCGSTVYWAFSGLGDMLGAELYGIAVGCFTDADFPQPTIECWTRNKQRWLAQWQGADSYEELPPLEVMLPRRS